jgi:hypothetical protein
MVEMRPIFLAVSVALLQPFAAAAAPPLKKPTKPWVLDYGETGCTALRVYGAAEAPVTLAFRPSPNGTVVRLVLSRPGSAPPPYHFPLATNIDPPTAKMTGLRFATRDKKFDVIWINFERAALDGLRKAGELSIKGDGLGRTFNQRFALPGIAKVLDGLDECNADLRQFWNVGDAAGRLSKPAEPIRPIQRYFSDSDYPAQAISNEYSGVTSYMMMVDETGALKDCMVEATSGVASLDAMTCIVLLERAKFRPALDASGKPAKSVVTGNIRWKMIGL